MAVLVAYGLSDDQIADVMELSPASAETQVSQAIIKLGAPDPGLARGLCLPGWPNHRARGAG